MEGRFAKLGRDIRNGAGWGLDLRKPHLLRRGGHTGTEIVVPGRGGLVKMETLGSGRVDSNPGFGNSF